MGKDIDSAQYNFSAAELAYIADNFIHLDHDQTWSGSAGVAYTFNPDSTTPTRVSADLLVQSGLRASTATIPNGLALPAYTTGNVSVVQRLRPGTELRLDVLNIGDSSYEIRNGTGVGVGAPQFGMRRTILGGSRNDSNAVEASGAVGGQQDDRGTEQAGGGSGEVP